MSAQIRSGVGVASLGIARMIGDDHCGVRYEINLICAQNLADHLCHVKRPDLRGHRIFAVYRVWASPIELTSTDGKIRVTNLPYVRFSPDTSSFLAFIRVYGWVFENRRFVRVFGPIRKYIRTLPIAKAYDGMRRRKLSLVFNTRYQ